MNRVIYLKDNGRKVLKMYIEYKHLNVWTVYMYVYISTKITTKHTSRTNRYFLLQVWGTEAMSGNIWLEILPWRRLFEFPQTYLLCDIIFVYLIYLNPITNVYKIITFQIPRTKSYDKSHSARPGFPPAFQPKWWKTTRQMSLCYTKMSQLPAAVICVTETIQSFS